MPRPTSRLDLFFVPDDRSSGAVDAARALVERWDPVPAGARAARLDDPGALVLYANRVGGFRATCGRCGASVAAALRPFAETPCGGCGAQLPFDEVVCRPEACIGRAAAVLVDVDTATVEAPPGFRRVLARM
jgi:hypothetical protein